MIQDSVEMIIRTDMEKLIKIEIGDLWTHESLSDFYLISAQFYKFMKIKSWNKSLFTRSD